ncbi:conserved Plasmodium protein, unknown function [Plasmodium berghei]|uniref:Uncharacterized protein n=2 Tax=Plasmodium berghei TaxID=5821 RepID=A0A509AKK9_PLABA|nr:conserved Plasmodium protein, unknown function [Plasmodium berghei ANKA]CXI50801.1 conserved Plasmodium protein, unknown function [Plasmodium berghei]SCL94327.1 conserved Plasmodium protein, unknown function [Plasmodium berghei]SCM15991.1 conserved Plasmodium protein, unknown function [Plasmodium berghei]SCM17787.1 conserved Plasmodium protein, unknown function [Plasmodium berghei]SCN26022.1 conserved Plasmodium protein, unknown function [Plasmodium berghei]|eukprot:XP_034421916.1 conserved Plasmodium protein, unknown function [Plasmodium berghei ANKA]
MMNENKKLDIIRNMLNTLLGSTEFEINNKNDEIKNMLKKKYIDKSKKVIHFYRSYMNILEQKELEKFSNLYDIILNNSFEYSEKDNIDTYMYCNIFPVLKKTFDSFVLYISKLIDHKHDENYKNIIKNINPILLFSQYIIRLSNDMYSESDIIDNNQFDIQISNDLLENPNNILINNINSNINDHSISGNYNNTVFFEDQNSKTEEAHFEKEIQNFYSKYDILEYENKLKEKEQKKEILKTIYHKKNLLSKEDISLYNAYYEQHIKLRRNKFRDLLSSTSVNLNDSKKYEINANRNSFSIYLDMKNRQSVIEQFEKKTTELKKKQNDETTEIDPKNISSFDEIIKKIEKKESCDFEKKIYTLLNKWIKEEDGRRFIINQKCKIEPLFNEFKKINHTITDKDIIPLIFFIDKNLYLNYSLVNQYNYNSFYYIFHLYSSFYCSDTNSITFNELWDFLVSNLPLNNYLYKNDIIIGFKKFEKRKKIIKNFHFIISFIKNFLIHFLIDIFLFISKIIKIELNSTKFFDIIQTNYHKITYSDNFYLYINSLSRFYSSSSSSSKLSKTYMSNTQQILEGNLNLNQKKISIEGKDELSMNCNVNNSINKQNIQITKNNNNNDEKKKNILTHLLLLLWGITIKLNIPYDDLIISDDISTDMDGEINEQISESSIDSLNAKEKKCACTQECEVKDTEFQKTIKNKKMRKRRNKYTIMNDHTYQSDHNIICKKNRKKNGEKNGNKMEKRKRTLSLDSEHTKWKKRDRICKTIKEQIKNKNKINIDTLKEIKSKKDEKYSHYLYQIKKKYKKKRYNEKITNLIHSIVKYIKPKTKNHYDTIINTVNKGMNHVFISMFNEENEKKDDIAPPLTPSVDILKETDNMLYINSFIQTNIIKKKKCINPILLLCNLKLYKKKFLNKFNTDHIYLLLYFVYYVNKRINEIINEEFKHPKEN